VEELEDAVRELLRLAGMKPLSSEDLKRAKELMRRLREMGWTNVEVSELTDGGWSESTVKPYTRGVKVKDRNPKGNVTSLFAELVSRGLSVEDVESVLSVGREIEARGVIFDDVAEVLEDSRKQGVDVEDLVGLCRDVKEAALTLPQIKELLSYRADLESLRITGEGIRDLLAMAKKIGPFNTVVKSIEEYGKLTAIQKERVELSAEVERLTGEKVGLEKLLQELKNTLEKLRKQEADIKDTIEKYRYLVDAGFTDEVLSGLKETLSGFGKLEDALSAVNTYASLKEIQDEKEKVEADLKSVQAQYADLQHVIALSRELLYKYGFSVDSIHTLYDLAKKHGNLYEVMKAVGAYGDLKALRNEIEKLEATRSTVEEKVKEARAQLQEVRGISDEVKKSARGLLKPLSSEINRGVRSIETAFSKAMQGIESRYEVQIRGLEEYAERLGKLKAEAGRLEEDLRFARVIRAALVEPEIAKQYPIGYVEKLIEVAYRLCDIKEFNPKVGAPQEVVKSSETLFVTSKVRVKDLLYWASFAFREKAS